MCACGPVSQLFGGPAAWRDGEGLAGGAREDCMQADPPFVSIIIPVKNEERILGRCLEAIARLDYPRDRVEVIVADGMSTDASRDIAERHGARVVPNGKGTVVAGRNRGFEAARGEFVAFTDADCVVSPDWLKEAVSAFTAGDIGGVGGVTIFPDQATDFQKAVDVLFVMAGLARSTSHVESAATERDVDDIPGCNAIYRREALEEVMPLDENLLTAEDVWLNWLLRERGYRQVLSGRVRLWHHRRSRPALFLRQIYRFAIGRLQVGKRSAALLKPVHLLAGLSVPLAAAVLIAGHLCKIDGVAGALLVLGCAACIIAGIRRTRSVKAALYVPAVVGMFFGAWSLGFMRELFAPMRNVDGK